MRKITLFLILFFALFSACGKQSKKPDLFSRIKQLEYQRNNVPSAWFAVYNKATTEEKYQVLLSAAATKQAQLVPFFSKAFKTASDDSLKELAAFGLGQIASEKAQNILLSAPFDSLSAPVKNAVIRALDFKCSNKTFLFLRSLQPKPAIRNTFLKALAICSRHKTHSNPFIFALIDSNAKSLSVSEAYFLSNTASYANIPWLIKKLTLTKGLAGKYLLKTLYKKQQQDTLRFSSILDADSMLRLQFFTQIKKRLSETGNWRMALYAAKLSPVVADSSFLPLYKKEIRVQNIHLKIAVWQAYGQAFPEACVSDLLQILPATKTDFYFRAELLKLLARLKPFPAYRLIMQELDKGDSFYKAGLLLGLCRTNLPQAFTTLRQFLTISDAHLVNTAFNCLAKCGQLRSENIKLLLNSSDFSSVATVLKYGRKHKRLFNNQKLLDLYKNFNRFPAFEVQKDIINLLKERAFKPDSLQYTFLVQNAAHPVIFRAIEAAFGRPTPAHFTRLKHLPSFLQPDSLKTFSTRPEVMILTNKGSIRCMLFPDRALLTVNNFLHLAEKKFYNKLTFHRVIADFVIQGGDPLGNGWGGPQYLIPSEDNPTPFRRGSLGMATAGFDTGGSQFFICQSEQPHLTGNYTLFGQVINGMDVVDNIVPGDYIISIKIDRSF